MFGLSQEEWQDLVLSVNVHRKARRLSPAVAAEYLDRAINRSTMDEVARALGFEETSTLRRIHRLRELPEDLVSLVEWGSRRGSMSMSTASELLRLGSSELIREAFVAAIEHEMTRDEARQLTQIRERSGEAIAECVRRVLLSRPKIERSELILGLLVSPSACERRKELGDELATKKLKLAFAKNYPDVVARSVRITGNRFSLLFSHDDAKKFREILSGSSVESSVTKLIEQF